MDNSPAHSPIAVLNEWVGNQRLSRIRAVMVVGFEGYKRLKAVSSDGDLLGFADLSETCTMEQLQAVFSDFIRGLSDRVVPGREIHFDFVRVPSLNL